MPARNPNTYTEDEKNMLALREENRKERQFGLVRDSVAEENSTLEERIAAREREMKIPPPQRNPFKIIPGLEA